ncbi:monovalent cation/H(+) antiporter subunit G [Nesterenkonia lacusekhoensis]|uniref:Multicomponent Na+:H+ antiporter subunit G n=1 Tax=Nesterenkonia lacusekhoensis TaxID=150832 RepID=A0ABS4T2D6_9MICC|nr:monovalent cation/H(+) antiporter subunit G [Nesterenkonia lacusekhoensis]MBP2318607.1 multicomponent Na+:H+ antiporter subunit G [Nesterenkonia lacusekhoensis]
MGIENILHGAGLVFIFLGIFTIIVSAIGLFRLPDLYLRASAVGTSAGLGVASIVFGALLMDFSMINLIKALIAIVAQLLTSAVGSMAIARSGYLNNYAPAEITHTDELALTKRG